VSIHVQRQAEREFLDEIGVFSWPIWEAKASEFPWKYETDESCYFLEGAVTVTPEGGNPVEIGRGDYVTFPAGLNCQWRIKRAVRKHYRLG